ncbi:hypothetical protein [Paractinoplanes globisporus]|uniref:Uncharacterized protein n=1 Tax=Paractinoplanes globisporus TaxID=113565 RepID=A0ABW6WFI0_9ACTN|nr:hypothetical protein [Actinoplanes globisporus]
MQAAVFVRDDEDGVVQRIDFHLRADLAGMSREASGRIGDHRFGCLVTSNRLSGPAERVING